MSTNELPESLDSETRCLAYAIWYWGPKPSDDDCDSAMAADGLVLRWVYSEELCAQDRCGYCAVWNPQAKVCPGVAVHARQSWLRAVRHPERRSRYLMRFGAFSVPFDLTRGELVTEVERQIRSGIRYAVAERE
ncbi:hypothetical protein AB0A74_07085 [Saccharothrix sp. NPDC042600]|uniref:hypothetical protein n=1 Tax=Saccharothrix TaxID=2071 RepID=UPI0033DE52FA|nr:hypothetical protein GCM10017745_30610 [Saccharothrix mutabilis subsp. capreolus]